MDFLACEDVFRVFITPGGENQELQQVLLEQRPVGAGVTLPVLREGAEDTAGNDRVARLNK